MTRDEACTLTFAVCGNNHDELSQAISERVADYFGTHVENPVIADAILRATAHVKGHSLDVSSSVRGREFVYTGYTADVTISWPS